MQFMIRIFWLGTILVAGTSAALAQSQGESTYNMQCQVCHGVTGASDTPAGRALQAKSMSDPQVEKASDTALIAFVKNGSGKMPPFKDKLTDGQIKDVIAYIRNLEKRR
jgi:cytochrome c6